MKNLWLGIALGTLAALIWGLFASITRLGVTTSLVPDDIVAIRFLVAGTLLSPFLFKIPWVQIRPLGLLILVSGAGAPYVLIVSTGLQYTPSSHFGVITPSCMLIFTNVGALLWLKEKKDIHHWIGIGVVITGIVLIGSESMMEQSHTMGFGDALFVLGGLFWAGFTLVARKYHLQAFHTIALVAAGSLLMFTPVYFYKHGGRLTTLPWTDVFTQAAYQGVASGILALWFYTMAVRQLGAARGALFGAVVPAATLVLSYFILSEQPSLLQYAGVALSCLGMIWVLRKRT